MQPIDPADSRPKFEQIAASIRAAILTGEFQPGAQLPIGRDLEKFFGVASMTVRAAIDVLRDELFVESRTGSGVYVRAQASQPVPDGQEHPLAGAASFIYEMGQLKSQPRTGWQLLRIPGVESVADHTFRVAMTGMILAAIAGADVGRTAALCVVHDMHETRVGDIQAVGRAYVRTGKPEAITQDQTADLPAGAASAIRDLVSEFEARQTLEAKLARDADKLEMLAQAIEYQKAGYDTSGWVKNAVNRLATDAGQRLAQAIQAGNPLWFEPFNESYAELRDSTRGDVNDT
jgi:5'-deoxynucleotidase YfbR-like HD superfamily hydrolase